MQIYSDSQLVVYQITEVYQAKREKMVAYLENTKELLACFSSYVIEVILWSKNAHEDALAKLSLTKDAELLSAISVEYW